jgi:putative SbcD/Mre11-related phosphoesterase
MPPLAPASSSLELEPRLFLDARRAVWFAEEEALAVADLHLGYAWGSRAAGNMLPLETPDDTIARLVALARDYGARQLLVLGDIVHRAVSLKPVMEELQRLHEALGAGTALRLLAGNHDRGLPRVLRECGLAATLDTHARLGHHLLMHGDVTVPGHVEGRVLIGHEHPAIRLGDGVASVKCPCFLVGPQLLVLPAFSKWAAGGDVRKGVYLSPLARETRFHRAVAILAGKLLPVPL